MTLFNQSHLATATFVVQEPICNNRKTKPFYNYFGKNLRKLEKTKEHGYNMIVKGCRHWIIQAKKTPKTNNLL